jgi:hypothetical protein
MRQHLLFVLAIFFTGLFNASVAVSSASKLDTPIIDDIFVSYFRERPRVRVDVSVEDATGRGTKALDFFLINTTEEHIPTTLRAILELAKSRKTEDQAQSFLEMNIRMLFATGSDMLKIMESLSEPGKRQSVSSFISLRPSEFP